MMGACQLPPNTAIGPMREMQSLIGALQANFEALLRRLNLARDLRFEPQLYNWLVVGITPGRPRRLYPAMVAISITLETPAEPQS